MDREFKTVEELMRGHILSEEGQVANLQAFGISFVFNHDDDEMSLVLGLWAGGEEKPHNVCLDRVQLRDFIIRLFEAEQVWAARYVAFLKNKTRLEREAGGEDNGL